MIARKIIIGLIIMSVVLVAGGVAVAEDYWVKVNGGNPVDDGSGLGTAKKLSTVKNGQGDLFYFFRSSNIRSAVMGGFSAGGQSPPKKWEFLTDNGWSGEPNTIPISISNTIGSYHSLHPTFRLFPLPGDDEGIFGTAAGFNLLNSVLWLDIHGPAVNIMFNDPNDGKGLRWRQWKSGTDYSPYFMRTLVVSWDGITADFDFDGDSETGIMVSNKGCSIESEYSQLTAVKYVHNDSTIKWYRWDNNGWVGDTSWPSQFDPYDSNSTWILDPNVDFTTHISYCPRVSHLGSGDYLVMFRYGVMSGSSWNHVYTAARYNEGASPSWSWWDGSGWQQGGSYNYGTLIDADVDESMKLVAADVNLVSTFYLLSGSVYELVYDERDGSAEFGTATQIATAESYAAIAEPNGTIWLYYDADPNIYLRKKVIDSNWSDALPIYNSASGIIKVLDVSSVGDSNVPIVFFTETGNCRVYAISPADANSYWSGETGVNLDAPPAANDLDERIAHQNNVVNNSPALNYFRSTPSHMAVDEDGYLYSPKTGFCSVVVRHKDDVNDANSAAWGSYWDHIVFPGGAEVDNVDDKVYVTNQIINGGCGSVAGGGFLRKFEKDMRVTSVGYKFSGSQSSSDFDRSYSPQLFGSANWPGDVAIDEDRGLLYVTSSSDCKIKIYDINDTEDKTGQDNKFARSYLESGFAGNDANCAHNIVDELVHEPNDPNTYLIEYASDANYVYWDVNSETLDNMTDFVKDLNDYNEFSSDTYRNRFVRQLSYHYKYRWDVPVYLADANCIGSEGTGNGQFRFPQGIDVDPNGYIYVADTVNHRIQKFDPNGTFVKSWGRLGRTAGEFIYPFGMVADPNYNLIYVTDPFNKRVQIFDRNGNFLYTWGSWDYSANPNSFYSDLGGVAADGAGNIYVGTSDYIAKFSIKYPNHDDDDNKIPDVLEDKAYIIVVSADEHSTITPDGDQLAHPNDDISFTFSADEPNGYYVIDVKVDGVSQGTLESYDFNDVNDNHTIELVSSGVYNTDKEKAYASIQAAINDANQGHTIVVAEGTYLISSPINFSGKTINLTGKDPNDLNIVANTIIESWAGDAVCFDSGEGSSSVLQGFTLISKKILMWQPDKNGIYCENSSPTIRKCILRDSDKNGIYCKGSSPTIANNKIYANDDSGIYCDDGSCPVVMNSWIYENPYGIRLADANSEPHIGGTTLVGNSVSGIYGISGADPNITNCIIWDCNDDLSGCEATYNCISDCNDANGVGNICGDANDPMFLDPNNDDYHLDANSPCIEAGDPNFTPDPNEVDIDGEEREMDVVDMGADEVRCGGVDPNNYDVWEGWGKPDTWCGWCWLCGDVTGDGFVTFGDVIQAMSDLQNNDTSGRSDHSMDGFLTAGDYIDVYNHYLSGEGCTPCE